ncbi:hypothetical protein XELAEV_18017125mg [Xenopus laevis]|uniref:Uncharacterized protein n=1 Tax=Xenopus laevis TaxID=8355 RepID=A0A974DB19_XENLA|nr:hypothetical protein XELAEV_18017125mg [Xenopus laevis]
MQMSKSHANIQKLDLEGMNTNMEKMSADLKKLTEKSQLLLCDLNLACNYQGKEKYLRKFEEKNIFKKEKKIACDQRKMR